MSVAIKKKMVGGVLEALNDEIPLEMISILQRCAE